MSSLVTLSLRVLGIESSLNFHQRAKSFMKFQELLESRLWMRHPTSCSKMIQSNLIPNQIPNLILNLCQSILTKTKPMYQLIMPTTEINYIFRFLFCQEWSCWCLSVYHSFWDLSTLFQISWTTSLVFSLICSWCQHSRISCRFTPCVIFTISHGEIGQLFKPILKESKQSLLIKAAKKNLRLSTKSIGLISCTFGW